MTLLTQPSQEKNRRKGLVELLGMPVIAKAVQGGGEQSKVVQRVNALTGIPILEGL